MGFASLCFLCASVFQNSSLHYRDCLRKKTKAFLKHRGTEGTEIEEACHDSKHQLVNSTASLTSVLQHSFQDQQINLSERSP
ncbi:MAG: hypothetical protein JWP89_3998 [Schlesneria sp.]|nr:hypothetical protein [Schlesneria sp.]